MKIIGINLNHISSAALYVNGNQIFASSEERFTRNKLTRAFPKNVIKEALQFSNLRMDDIDAFAIGWNPSINLENFKNSFSYTYRWFPELLYTVPNNLFEINKIKNHGFIEQNFYSSIFKKEMRVIYINHHLCHAAQSFLSSGFNTASLLTIDGFGERTSSLWGTASQSEIKIEKEEYFPQSLGSFYETITDYLGFKPDADEWKVMGMSAFGDKNKFSNQFDKILKLKTKGEYELDLTYFNFFNFDRPGHFSKKFEDLFGKEVKANGIDFKKIHYDFAASAQKKFEDCYINAFNHLVTKNKSKKSICLGGGATMNCLANGVLSQKFPNIKIHVPFAPDDLGLSMGAALYATKYIYRKKVNHNKISTFSGREYLGCEIKRKLDNYKLKYKYHKKIESIAAKLIANGNVIGWYQGRSEFGQRALGNRSILGDARNPKIKDIVNKKIKYREKFRPFAPSVLEQYAHKYFYISRNINPSHMQFAVKVKKKAKTEVPGIVHNDDTARIQTVTKKMNKKYESLISEFYKITGTPILLNTSFNLKGEPIVDTPEDAIRTFNTSGIDILILGNFLISKN